jgi:hypothetical protein
VPGQGRAAAARKARSAGSEEAPPTTSAEDLQLVVEHRILECQFIEAAADDQA